MCRATTWMAMHSLLLGNAEAALLFFIHICLDSQSDGYFLSGWTMVYGQKIVAAPITNGMVLHALQSRC
jgi:hypothetical protein